MKKPFFKSFFFRTFAGYIGMTVLVFISVFILFQPNINQFYIDGLRAHLKNVGYALSPKIRDLYDRKDFEGLDEMVKQVGRKVDMRITVIDREGVVIADSQRNPRLMENHGDRPEIMNALKGNTRETTRFSSTMGEQMFYLALPVMESEGIVIRISVLMRDVERLEHNLMSHFITVLLLLLIPALGLAWILSRSISKPISRIVQATREFASGNFDIQIILPNKDELGEVAESFNNMVNEQNSLFKKLSHSREELQTIISSMKEGLLVITPEGKITLCNDSLQNITRQKIEAGCFYWEALRISGFEEAVNKAFHEDDSFYGELEWENKFYLAGFNRMNQGGKLVVTFQDMTQFKQLEKMKKEFVTNLTHELKTPLTAIKGFVETLEEEENLQNPKYIEIIKRHTDRMTQIVSDMMFLSELEERDKGQVFFKPLDLVEIVEGVLPMFREKIKEKGLLLNLFFAGNIPQINGERFKIEQMFINLLDNAVKYTDKGKIEISIQPGEDGKYVEVSVINTGEPIPAKSIPRLFERFYVIDKSRSRRLGGTGLGLAIVKHVVLLHGGEIDVESLPGEGTVFKIRLPIM